MNTEATGCGSGSCQCAGSTKPAIASINGIALHEPGEHLTPAEMRERAWAELLRQEAVRQGLLPKSHVLSTSGVTPLEEEVIHQMLEDAARAPAPDVETCRRYHEANPQRFVDGREVHVRHILFAVTDGVDVNRLAVKAGEVLLELMRKDAPEGLFAQRAGELSNCPSGANGGDLGWLGPHDCADELSNELFPQKTAHAMGLRPRLVHSRYGLHIVEVRGRKDGRPLSFEEVHGRIALELAQQSRATALHQYIRLLAGRAAVEGIELEAAATPLVQ
jgi:peptidyl-prolyl cis-trans isomerase C